MALVSKYKNAKRNPSNISKFLQVIRVEMFYLHRDLCMSMRNVLQEMYVPGHYVQKMNIEVKLESLFFFLVLEKRNFEFTLKYTFVKVDFLNKFPPFKILFSVIFCLFCFVFSRFLLVFLIIKK